MRRLLVVLVVMVFLLAGCPLPVVGPGVEVATPAIEEAVETPAIEVETPEAVETPAVEVIPEITPMVEVEMTPEMTPEAEAMATVNTGESDELGQFLTDAEGNTLYAFTADEEGVSNCTGDCATNWPPLTVESEDELMAGEGVDEAMLGTIERDDGTLQVTYNGMPLYLFARDEAPGDVTGQGVGERWYVVSLEGEMIQE